MVNPQSASAGEGTQTRRDARENRARILGAAREVFTERGLDAEIKEIADRAGVGIGTIYRNFPSKDHLIDGIVDDLVAQMSPALDAALVFDQADEGLEYLLHQAFAAASVFGPVVSVLMAMPDRITSVKRERLSDLVTLIERGARQGVLRSDIEPLFITAFIQSALPELYLRLREGWSEEQVRQGCVTLLMSALRPPPNKGPS